MEVLGGKGGRRPRVGWKALDRSEREEEYMSRLVEIIGGR